MSDADSGDRTKPAQFCCPNTGKLVEHFLFAAPEPGDDTRYDVVKCLACEGMHLINRMSGKPIGE